MGSRNPQKEMMKNHGAFETSMELIEHAITSSRTKSKNLNGLSGELKTFFYRYVESYRLYKADFIAKDSSTVAAFNGKDALLMMLLTAIHSMTSGPKIR